MSVRTRTSRRGRAVTVAVLGFVFVAAVIRERASPSRDFYSTIEPHPLICQIVRPFFAVVGQGAEFDAQIKWAALAKALIQVDQATLIQQMLCPSHIPPAP